VVAIKSIVDIKKVGYAVTVTVTTTQQQPSHLDAPERSQQGSWGLQMERIMPSATHIAANQQHVHQLQPKPAAVPPTVHIHQGADLSLAKK
jgi:hypothetical protein